MPKLIKIYFDPLTAPRTSGWNYTHDTGARGQINGDAVEAIECILDLDPITNAEMDSLRLSIGHEKGDTVRLKPDIKAAALDIGPLLDR